MLKVTDSGPRAEWTDEQLANAAAEVYFELLDVTFAEITEATRHCKQRVPTSGGLPALRHAIRRQALGLRPGDEQHLATSACRD